MYSDIGVWGLAGGKKGVVTRQTVLLFLSLLPVAPPRNTFASEGFGASLFSSLGSLGSFVLVGHWSLSFGVKATGPRFQSASC